MSSQTRAERRRDARAKKKRQRLAENTVICYHKLMGYNFQQSRQSLAHENKKAE